MGWGPGGGSVPKRPVHAEILLILRLGTGKIVW